MGIIKFTDGSIIKLSNNKSNNKVEMNINSLSTNEDFTNTLFKIKKQILSQYKNRTITENIIKSISILKEEKNKYISKLNYINNSEYDESEVIDKIKDYNMCLTLLNNFHMILNEIFQGIENSVTFIEKSKYILIFNEWLNFIENCPISYDCGFTYNHNENIIEHDKK